MQKLVMGQRVRERGHCFNAKSYKGYRHDVGGAISDAVGAVGDVFKGASAVVGDAFNNTIGQVPGVSEVMGAVNTALSPITDNLPSWALPVTTLALAVITDGASLAIAPETLGATVAADGTLMLADTGISAAAAAGAAGTSSALSAAGAVAAGGSLAQAANTASSSYLPTATSAVNTVNSVMDSITGYNSTSPYSVDGGSGLGSAANGIGGGMMTDAANATVSSKPSSFLTDLFSSAPSPSQQTASIGLPDLGSVSVPASTTTGPINFTDPFSMQNFKGAAGVTAAAGAGALLSGAASGGSTTTNTSTAADIPMAQPNHTAYDNMMQTMAANKPSDFKFFQDPQFTLLPQNSPFTALGFTQPTAASLGASLSNQINMKG